MHSQDLPASANHLRVRSRIKSRPAYRKVPTSNFFHPRHSPRSTSFDIQRRPFVVDFALTQYVAAVTGNLSDDGCNADREDSLTAQEHRLRSHAKLSTALTRNPNPMTVKDKASCAPWSGETWRQAPWWLTCMCKHNGGSGDPRVTAPALVIAKFCCASAPSIEAAAAFRRISMQKKTAVLWPREETRNGMGF